MHEYRRFSIAERDRRWAAVRRLMQRDNLAAIVAPPNNGNSTDWQADARYLSHCGGGADASIAVVFPLDDAVTVVATSAVERWGPLIQDWVSDVREANRRYGRVMGERLRELNITNERIGISGLGGGTRTPEGTLISGTFDALTAACPHATFVDASDLLQEVRELKSDEEVAVLQRSVELVERGVEAQTRAAQPGVPDYVVWAETMHAMYARGSEQPVHFNWIAAQKPGRTLTRPTGRPLVEGDVIVAEIESSVIGYRAQQIRPIAVRRCDPVFLDLSKMHAELYMELLGVFRPGISVAELIDETIAVGKKVALRSGPLANVKSSLIVHGRGLGDDRPLLLTNLDAKPMYEGTERAMSFRFPANGVYIVKPTLSTPDKTYQFIWGDSVHLSARGAHRMGRSPLGITIAEPSGFANWPTDVTVYSKP
ncbi:MAG TPA: M24 family metallopeptidase [Candidatus Lustribacter sp.]|nr:M24 family metallopeptidase [Candidatus Lustribacter sp.]